MKKLKPCKNCGTDVHIEVEDCDYPVYEFIVCPKCKFTQGYHLDHAKESWGVENIKDECDDKGDQDE